MNVSKKSSKINRYQLAGSQKKNGLNIWRFVFNGTEKITGRERKFFIELSMLNSGLSPDEAVLGFKARVNISAEDLQNVLAGSVSAKNIQSESYVVPSYIVLRAGVLGPEAKQLCSYCSEKQVSVNSKNFCIKGDNFSFDGEKLSGRIDCSLEDIHEHPEYLCDSGSLSWDLRYEIRCAFSEGYSGKNCVWVPTGAKTVFTGNFILDGKVYEVVPKKSAGYLDRFFGKDVVFPWVHISSNALTSIISGKILSDSTFAVQGAFEDQVSAVVELEGNAISFEAGKSKFSNESVWNFSEMPENNGEENLHWSVSLNNKSYVVDIDVFCPAPQMYVKSVEIPEGKRNVLKMLCGGTGTGEIRLYRQFGKNLELIEHAKIAGALCEYGQLEKPE